MNLDHGKWKCHVKLEKRNGDINASKNNLIQKIKKLFTGVDYARREFLKNVKPFEVLEFDGNCLLNSGIDEIWELVAGASTNHFDNSNAQIGVGDSSTSAAATQTDLQAATNKTYKAMESSYPTHTTQAITFKSSFGASDANYAWNEWVVKQNTSSICLNRKAESLGTKTTGTWTLEVSVTLA